MSDVLYINDEDRKAISDCFSEQLELSHFETVID